MSNSVLLRDNNDSFLNRYMDSDNKNNEEEKKATKQSGLGIIVHSFFIIPFMITVFSALLFLGTRLLTHEDNTVYDYLNDIKVGGVTKRWQAAFELSKSLADPKSVPTDERFTGEMIELFETSKGDDDRIRQYLALAMGRTGLDVFTTPLIGALNDNDSKPKHAYVHALGLLRSREATPYLIKLLDDSDSKLRLYSVIALGHIGGKSVIPYLRKALKDPEPNVRWDAAIALAKERDPMAKNTLLDLLNREYYAQFTEVDPYEKSQAIIIAIEAASYLNDHDLQQAIMKLSQNDPNIKVKEAALSQLK